MNKKAIFTISILICILLTITSVSANDIDLNNITSIAEQSISQATEIADSDDGKSLTISASDDELLSASTVYFDASAASDGDGSQSRPYKYLKSDRLNVGTTAYFANGVYNITDSIYINSYSPYKTTLIGESSTKTIFNSLTNYDFIVSNEANLVLKNVYCDNVTIINQGHLDATNVNFENTKNTDFGVICSPNCDATPTININNCNFNNNAATYYASAITSFKATITIQSTSFSNSRSEKFGGAIYASKSKLTISDCSFNGIYSDYGGAIYSEDSQINLYNSNFDNVYTYEFGGAIASTNNTVTINKCHFNNCAGSTDDGGALYSVGSELKIYDSSFKVCYASNFGGAICNLKTNLTLENSYFENNKADYGQSIYSMYGNIRIIGNTFTKNETAHKIYRPQSGAIINELVDSFTETNNKFIDADSLVNHKSDIDGFSGKVTENNNIFRDIYTFACVYKGLLNGVEYQDICNYLLFSVSNDGTYLPLNSQSFVDDGESEYVKVSISFSDKSSAKNTTLTQNNKVFFDLTKKNGNIINERLDFFIIDSDTGAYWSVGSYELDNKNYANQQLTEFNFNSLMNMQQYSNTAGFSPTLAPQIFNFTQQPESQTTIPSSYDSRDYGYITSVKHQLDGGNCWAFSGIATLEACLKKASGETFDLSEENAKNLMAEFSSFGRNISTNGGGNQVMFTAYLTSWLGPIFGDAYDPHSSISPTMAGDIHIQNVYLIPDRKNSDDNDAVKRAIMNYGAVSIAVPNWDGTTGHAITLIGWDDNYNSFDCFGKYSKGAWIFKNSWGDGWKDNGFYYLSFERTFTNAYTFILEPDRGYTRNYQYDYAGRTSTLTTQKNGVYYKNKFTAVDNEILSAVSTYFGKETDFTISIYLNNKLVTSQDGHAISGYYTIPLNKEINLKKGDEFIVQFRCKNTNEIPISNSKFANKIRYTNGISFISTDGTNWKDVYNITNSKDMMVACIKAFTRQSTMKIIEMNITPFSEVEINKEITIPIDITFDYNEDGYAHPVFGHVTFNINGKTYYGYVGLGSGELKVSFDKAGHYVLTAQYISNKEISNVVSFSFDVVDKTKASYTITSKNSTKYYDGKSSEYSAQVYKNGVALSGAKVKLTVDGKEYSLTTDSTGKVQKSLNLNPGSHLIYCTYEGKTSKSKYVVKSTIGAVNTNGAYGNAKVSATFLNTNGKFLTSGQAIFKVGNIEFKGSINKNGVATADVNLGVGSYNVIITNPVTQEQTSIVLTISKTYKTATVTTQQNGNTLGVTINVDSAATGYVYLYIDDVLQYGEIKDGKVTFTFDDCGLGEHTIKVRYLGDDNFGMDTKTVKLVNSYKIQSNAFNAIYGQSKNIAVKLIDYKGNPVANAKVHYSITGPQSLSGNLVTGSNGKVNLKFNKAPGTYTVKLTSANNGYKTYKIKIYKASSAFKANAKAFKVNVKVKKYNAVLKANGKALAGKKVTLTVNGKTYAAKTNSKGVATIKITKLNRKGTFKASVKFAGDKYYNKAAKSVKIAVR